MKVFAVEGKPHKITVSTVFTGWRIYTPMSDSSYTSEMQIGIVAPTTLAPAFAFLAGIDADFATGHWFNAYQVSEAMRSARDAVAGR